MHLEADTMAWQDRLEMGCFRALIEHATETAVISKADAFQAALLLAGLSLG
jgi:hypothetical protein